MLLFKEILSIDSTSGKERDMALWLHDHLEAPEKELMEVGDGTLNLFLRWGTPRVVFCTHMDTVPPYIPPVFWDDKVCGRGSCDAKGQIFAMYTACKKLEAAGSSGFGLLILAGEETGSWGAKAFSKTGFIFDRDDTSLGLQQQFVYHDLKSVYFGRTDYEANQLSYYANLLFDSYLVNDHHKYSLGASYSFDKYNESLNDSTFKRIEHVPGVFAEYVFNDDHHWSVIAGFRADYNSYYQKMLYTPRLHVRFKTHDEFTVRVSAGKGYRSPNVLAENSTMFASARHIVFRDMPKMEEAWNYGINLTKGIDIGWRELVIQADFYRTDFVNQIVLDRDADAHQVLIYNLDGKSYSNSAQIEANCEIFKDFDLTLAFRYNDVKMSINDTLMEKPFVNRYKGLVTMSYAPGTWQFDLTTQFNGDSRVPNLDGNATAVEHHQNIKRSPFYVVMNAQVTKKFGEHWEVYVGGENLTNYTQKYPIVSAENPMSDDFDASMVWGPLSGIRAYLGVRFQVK